jgi:V/A-type H+-transporting ATPase subunit D
MAMPTAASQTRIDLINLRKKLSLAQRGKDLLQEKMDALAIEFFNMARSVSRLRREAMRKLAEAHASLSTCLGLKGTIETMQSVRETRKDFEIEISSRIVMGVEVPQVTVTAGERPIVESGYGIYTTGPTTDRAAGEFREALRLLCELAGLESSLRMIARELEKTRRRVNALEHVTIPETKVKIKMIEMKLDEIERDNFVRLKGMKTLRERRE